MSLRGRRKGRLGGVDLPIAPGYLRPGSHGRLLGLGLLIGALAAGAALLASRLGDPTALSGGPLSSAHAVVENDCAACHGGFEKLADAACSTCHEKLGDQLGLYTYAAHYVYRSGDFQRVGTREREVPCATCHPEHRGRDAEPTAVADRLCIACHAGTAFSSGHPEFAFVAHPDRDDDALRFAHGNHAKRVMERLGIADLERACLACHLPDAAGRGFQPIDFDRSCDACHLQAGDATGRLPLAAADAVGVESLEAIRASGGPGTQFALFVDPAEFRAAGSTVVKTTVHHRDPWILYNLRRLRKLLYPDAGLADLLVASPDPAADPRELYREAAATLEGLVSGLRGSSDPGVQAQLATAELVLGRVRRALEDPATPLDEAGLALAFGREAELPAEERAAIEELIGGLTAPCGRCHRLEHATIARVRADQKTLRRAEFDHRAHVIQRRCLDCHSAIPVLDALAGAALPPEVDNSGIHDLPRIAACRECHRSGLASTRCVQCHLFHPDQGRRSSLLLYREET